MGHSYTPIFRITPLAGPTSTVALSTFSFVRKCQPSYEPIISQQEMLDRSIRQVRYGYRCRVAMEFDFVTPSANETTLAGSVIDPALDDNQQVELTLDNGTTYRVVLLEEFSQAAMADKNIGVQVAASWVCRDLLSAKPPIGSGAW